MMRAPDRWAVAVRLSSGEVAVHLRDQPALATRHRWARWPVIRGNIALYEAVALGWAALQTSAQIAMEEAAPQQAGQRGSRFLIVLSGIVAVVVAIGLFVLLPTFATDLFRRGGQVGTVASNAIEGALRLAAIIGYIAGVGLLPDIRRVFQYHGAEHAAINCYEAGQPLTPDNVLRFSVLHPRCGTSFLLTVIVVKLVVNCFLGWPDLWLRALLRIAVLPLVAALAYEVIYLAGRQREMLWARLLALPGLLLERLTTRRPSRDQAEVAIYALAAVAPDAQLPAELPPPKLWSPAEQESSAAVTAQGPPASQPARESHTDGSAATAPRDGSAPQSVTD